MSDKIDDIKQELVSLAMKHVKEESVRFISPSEWYITSVTNRRRFALLQNIIGVKATLWLFGYRRKRT